jgi:GTPase SAR1 family protein
MTTPLRATKVEKPTRKIFLMDGLQTLKMSLEAGKTTLPLKGKDKKLLKDAQSVYEVWWNAGRVSMEEAYEMVTHVEDDYPAEIPRKRYAGFSRIKEENKDISAEFLTLMRRIASLKDKENENTSSLVV